MMAVLRLALLSLWNRRTTASLTIATIAISTALLLGVQLLKNAAREGFSNTLSGTDLIVGARSGPINLLLYSVFRIGDATTNVSWSSYQKISQHPQVAWTIPLSLGDTHRGFRVLATNQNYFEHYQFADRRPLRFVAGHGFEELYDVALGAEVASSLRYQLGESIVIAHGLGKVSFQQHDDHKFRVVGILARTGTPVDRTVHIQLDAMNALHGHEPSAGEGAADSVEHAAAAPGITAFLVGMRSRVATFALQRAINEYQAEPLLAILPGVTLSRLWELVGVLDTALTVIAAFVVLAGLVGMLSAILTSLNERRREMAVLRSVGARPRHIVALLLSESALLTLTGVLIGVAITYGVLLTGQPSLENRFGIFIAMKGPSPGQVAMLAGVVLCGVIIGLAPALRAYRITLNDGLQLRV